MRRVVVRKGIHSIPRSQGNRQGNRRNTIILQMFRHVSNGKNATTNYRDDFRGDVLNIAYPAVGNATCMYNAANQPPIRTWAAQPTRTTLAGI
jgi:hypothetical protein